MCFTGMAGSLQFRPGDLNGFRIGSERPGPDGQGRIPTVTAAVPPTWNLTVPGAGAAQHAISRAGGEAAHPASTPPSNSNRTNRIMADTRTRADRPPQARNLTPSAPDRVTPRSGSRFQ